MSEEMDDDIDDAVEEAEEPTNAWGLKRKQKLAGKVTRLELYGAFIDIGYDTEALVHISQIGKEHVNRVADVLNVGDEVSVWVDKVDPSRGQIMVTMIQPLAVDWSDLQKGSEYTGSVTRLETYGAFVDIGAEREGLVHISELSHQYVKHPSEVVSVGDEVRVQVLGFSKKKRRIDLSIKALVDAEQPDAAPVAEILQDQFDDEEEELEELPTAMEIALRRAMGDSFKQHSRRHDRDRQRKQKARSQQEDILSRTLQTGSEN
jgi:predicted RNA-binding protein with RPS1 domain